MVVLVATLLAAALPFGVRPALAQPAELLVGRLAVIRGDDDLTGAPVAPTVLLVTDDGRAVRLLPDAAAGQSITDLLAYDGRRVAVGGAPLSGPATATTAAASALSVGSLRSLEADPVVAEMAAASGQWISIACRFADSTATLKPLSHFEGMYRSAAPSLTDYWRVASGGTLDLSGSTAVGWYDLPGDRASYMLTSYTPNFETLLGDCTAAADADVDYNAYAGVNLFFSDSLGGSSYGVRYPIALDGADRLHGVTFLAPAIHSRLATIQHEMGHGYGMDHAVSAAGAEYVNSWDVMGKSGGSCSLVDAVYGCVGQLPTAALLDRAGLLPAGSAYAAQSGTQTVTLGAAGYALARIPVAGDPNRYFVVESRTRSGYDQQLPATAVVIHDVITNRANWAPAAWLVGDYVLNGSTTDSAWLPGEVYIAPVGEISVEVVAGVTGGHQVIIRKDTPYTPPAPPPTPPPPPPPAPEPEPLTVVAGDDSYVASNALSKAFGSLKVLRVKDTARVDFVAYLKFEVSGLTGTPAAAKLRLYVTDTGTDGGTIYRVANESRSGSAWTEKSLTWATAPALGQSLARIGAVPKKGWVEIDLGRAISGNGTYSFAIRNASTNQVAYGSSESKTPPQLIIIP